LGSGFSPNRRFTQTLRACADKRSDKVFAHEKAPFDFLFGWSLPDASSQKARRERAPHLSYNNIIKSTGVLISAIVVDLGYQQTPFQSSSKF
jgi:hypothetical protein